MSRESSSRAFRPWLLGAVLVLATATPARAQLEITVHGGVHAARLDRPERELEQPARGIGIQSAPGEATALGIRLSGPLARHWGWDAGAVWSRNRSAQGSFGAQPPEFETSTLFLAGTAQVLLTGPEARLALRAGAGPALVLHRGTGTSLLTRQTDLGAALMASARYSIDGRLGVRLDAQQYLFSSSFREPYAGQFVGDPVQPAGSQFRHELVLLAGLSWRTH